MKIQEKKLAVFFLIFYYAKIHVPKWNVYLTNVLIEWSQFIHIQGTHKCISCLYAGSGPDISRH